MKENKLYSETFHGLYGLRLGDLKYAPEMPGWWGSVVECQPIEETEGS